MRVYARAAEAAHQVDRAVSISTASTEAAHHRAVSMELLALKLLHRFLAMPAAPP
jgi:hypothetical protein